MDRPCIEASSTTVAGHEPGPYMAESAAEMPLDPTLRRGEGRYEDC